MAFVDRRKNEEERIWESVLYKQNMEKLQERK